VRRLEKTYPGGVEAVKGIDFDVAAGEVFGLLGPNGAGKSTTIGILTTTIAPTGGSATLAGFDVIKRPLLARSVSSVVFQEPVLDRGLSGRANLRLHRRLWGVDGAGVRGGSATWPSCWASSICSIAPWRVTPGVSGGDWRSRARSCRARGCRSSTSVPRRADGGARPADPAGAVGCDRRGRARR
jgi:hypothetical protein